MEKLLKLNNRVAVEKISPDECIFLIDGLKNAIFIPQDEEFCKIIANLTGQGIEKDSINIISSDIHRKRAHEFIKSLEFHGFVDYDLKLDCGIKVQICPCKQNFQFPVMKNGHVNKLLISNHTFSRYSNEAVILENPLSTFKLCIKDVFFNLQSFLENQKAFNELLSILLAGGFVTESESDYCECEWEFHDLLFHTRSRLGMADDSSNLGGTYRFKPDNIGVHNEFKDYQNKIYFLFDLPVQGAKGNKTDLFELLQTRKSSRSFSKDKSLSYDQIGEFLFHSAKIIYSIPQNGHLDFVKRAFPSAGGIHDLEFYLLINRSGSLKRDIYYYHPQKHGLYQLQVKNKYLDKITQNAVVALGSIEEEPPVIVILTSRFMKMRSKYERIAYRNTILSVGAAIQTMYLTGAAMNLSTCALGSGNPALFAEAIGVDPLEECAVGEFVLGP